MRYLYYVIITVLLSTCTITLKAQKCAGYLGKHFMAGYNLTTTCPPSIIFKQHEYKNLLAFNHALNFDYIVSRKMVLGLRVGYMKHKYQDNFSLVSDDFGNETLEYKSRYLTNASAAFALKYYNPFNSVIAPVGTFAEYRLSVMSITRKVVSQGKTFKDDPLLTPAFGFTYGISRVIQNSAVIEAGIDINLPLRLFSLNESDNKLVEPNDDYIFKEKGNFGFMYSFNYLTGLRVGVSGLFF